MRMIKPTIASGAVLALALVATGCSSSEAPKEEGPLTSASADSAFVTANGSEPQNPLIPTMTVETGGGKILDLIFAGLVYYDEEGATHNDVAESIETEDNVTWTIKLKKGQMFTDGTEVQAHNFIEAWNMGYREGHDGGYFFEPIEGYEYSEDGKTALNETMSGLQEVDDYTFTVKLKQPEADFAQRLGYAAFFPLPDSTLKDPKTGGQNPVGNGPYKLADKKAWEHNVQISLVPNEEYKGDRKPENNGVRLKFYPKQEAAYADLQQDKLDVLDAVPETAFDTYEKDLDGRTFNQPAAIFQSFVVPQYVEHFAGEEGALRNAAISMAINREQITKKVFKDTRTPAKDFTSPVINGWHGNIAGNEVLKYNKAEAKKLWKEADEKYGKYEGTFTIAYNADGGHDAWVKAVTNQIKNTLGIKAEGQSYPDFKSLLDDRDSFKLTGAYRSGWQADYPGLYNFLAPLYATGAGSNESGYSNEEFDGLLKKAAAADSVEDSNKILDEAQTVLFKDMPAVPLWYSNATGGWSSLVDNVKVGWNSVPIFEKITKK